MKRTRKWHKKLTIAELKHLNETMDSPPTIRGLKGNRKGHLEQVALGKKDPCIECRIIARKLGIE